MHQEQFGSSLPSFSSEELNVRQKLQYDESLSESVKPQRVSEFPPRPRPHPRPRRPALLLINRAETQ